MTDLVDFIRARLREGEEFARIAHLAARHRERMLCEVEAKRRILDLHHAVEAGNEWIANDAVAADQAVLSTAFDGLALVKRYTCVTCHTVPEDRDYDNCCGDEPYPCPTLRLLALMYADHPDYREEWRP